MVPAGTAEEMKVKRGWLCARRGAGDLTHGGPPVRARGLSGRGVTPQRVVPSSCRFPAVQVSGGHPPACPAEPAVALRPQGDASSAQALPAPPRCGQGGGVGGERGPPPKYLRLSGKSISSPQLPRTKGRRAGSLRVKEAASRFSLTVKWGQTHLSQFCLEMDNGGFLALLESSVFPLSLSSIRGQICHPLPIPSASGRVPGTQQALNTHLLNEHHQRLGNYYPQHSKDWLPRVLRSDFTSPTSSGALAQAGQILLTPGPSHPIPTLCPHPPTFLFQLFPLWNIFSFLSSNQIQTPSRVVLHPLLFHLGSFPLQKHRMHSVGPRPRDQ